jgi:hypothetical protein
MAQIVNGIEFPDDATDDEILGFFNANPDALEQDVPTFTDDTVGTAALKGFYGGVADVVGAPVDLANFALRQTVGRLGIPGATFEGPAVGGSESLRGLLEDAGELPFAPEGGYTFGDIEELRPSIRPFAVMGETAGQSLPFAVAPLALARTAGPAIQQGGNVLQQVGREIVDTARRKPMQFAATEAGLTAGASVGAGAAEAIDPGDPTSRLIGELTGVFSPTIVATQLLPSLTDSVRRFTSSYTPGGRVREAARVVQREVVQRGENRETLARALESDDAISPAATAGQRTESEALLALENTLIKESGETSQEAAKQAEQAIDDFNAAYRNAVSGGNPNALREIAVRRKQYFDALLDQRVSRAEQAAQEAANNAARQSPEARTQANMTGQALLRDALKDARKHESSLWTEVPKETQVTPSNLNETLKAVKAELLDEETLSAPIEAFGKRVKQAVEPVGTREVGITSGDLLRFRSRALEFQRDALGGSKPNFGDARRFRQLADAALDDLATIPGAAADDARRFSFALNERFNRSFASKALGFDKELALEKAIAGGGREAAVRGRQVEEAVQPFGGMDADAVRVGEARVGEMREAQEAVLRDMAQQTRNPDGSVNPNALNRFIETNREMVQRLGLEPVFADAALTQQIADRIGQQSGRARKFFEQRSAAARVLNVDDPAVVVRRALASDTVSADFKSLVSLARKDQSGQALDGLRSAVFDTLFDGATVRSGLISSDRLATTLSRKVGNKTLRQQLIDSGALTEGQARNLDRVTAQAARFENALNSGATVDDLLATEDVFFDLFTRLVGANIGGAGAVGQVSGAPLVAAQAGSRAAQSVLSKVPRLRVREVLKEAAFNPKFMAALLRKPVGVRAKNARDRQIRAFLLQAGIIEENE